MTGKYFVITGINGFMGRNTAYQLLNRGATVVGNSLESCVDEWISNHPRYHHVDGSLLQDSQKLSQTIDSLPGDKEFSLFHCAGMAAVQDCNDNPHLAHEINVTLVEKTLEFAHSYGFKSFLFPSSQYVYGNSCDQAFTEGSPLNPQNVYAQTKVDAEEVIQNFCKDKPLQYAIGRLTNTYGLHIGVKSIVGMIINNAVIGEPLKVRSTLSVRDFLYVKDVVSAFLAMSESGDSHLVNIATGEPTSIYKLIQTAALVFGAPFPYADEKESIDSSQMMFSSPGLLKKSLGWKPEYNLEQGLTDLKKLLQL